MRVARPVVLSAEQRDMLELRARARSAASRSGERARIVLLAAAGMQDQQIATKLRIMLEKAARWRNRFLDGRCGGLGQRRAKARQEANNQPGSSAGSDPEDHAGEARQCNPLEHAQHGTSVGSQRKKHSSDLAQTRSEATPVPHLESQQRSRVRRETRSLSWGFISIRRNTLSLTRKVRYRLWTVRNPVCRSKRAAAEP
jgi:hypothetical protein